MKRLALLILMILMLTPSKQIQATQTPDFLINGKEIGVMYDQASILQFQLPKDQTNVVLFRVENEKRDIVDTITWEYIGEMQIGTVSIEDGTEISYELVNHEETWKTPVFSQDSKPCEILILQNEIEVEDHQWFQSKTAVTIKVFDEHFEHSEGWIINENGKQQLQWQQEQQSEVALQYGENQIHVEAWDAYGHQTTKEISLWVDDILPKMTFLLNDQPLLIQPYAKEVNVTLTIEEDYLDEAASYLLVNDKLAPLTWEIDNLQHIATYTIQDEGVYQLSFHIQDVSGNSKEEQIELAIDKTAPQLQTYVDEVLVENIDDIYAREVDLSFKVSDFLLNEKNSWISWNQKRYTWDQFPDLHITDGEYTFAYYLEDMAGNINQKNSVSVIVDSQAPKVSIEPSWSSYGNQAQTLAIRLEDKHIDGQQIECKLNGNLLPREITWEHEENAVYTTLHYQEEGTYEIKVTCEDIAGHKTQNQIEFTIDQIAPLVHFDFLDQEFEGYFNHERSATLRVQDANLDKSQLEVSIELDGKKQEIPLIWKNINMGVETNVKFTQDASYTVSYTVKDLGGNQKSDKLAFEIDRQPPEVWIKTVDAFQQSRVVIPFYIKDKHLASYKILVNHDETINLQTGFKNKEEQLVFEEEGTYEISIVANDFAGNHIEQTVSFIIDHTKPVIDLYFDKQLVGADTYISNQDLLLMYQVKEVYPKQLYAELYEDDHLIQSWDTAELTTSIPVKQQSEHRYTMKIHCIDQAGNETNREANFLLDRYLPIPYIDNDVFHGKDFNGTWIPKLSMEGKEFQVVDCALWRNGKKISYVWGQEISEDGVYELSVATRDQAMNMMQLTPIFQFTIDHQAPVIQLYDQDHAWFIEDKAPLHSTLCLYLEQEDMTKRGKENFVSIFVNDISFENHIKRDETSLAYVLLPIDERLHIKVKAIDEAGNESSIDRIIEPIEETEAEEMIKESQQDHPVMNQKLLPKTEAESEKLSLYFALSIAGISTFVYGCRRLSAHHHK